MWAGPELEFIEDGHIYKLQGKRLPGIHDILTRFRYTDTKFIDQGYLDRGRAIHQGAEHINKGVYDQFDHDPQIEPYMEAYRKFVKETGWVCVESEKMAYNPVMGYACRVDAFGYFTDNVARKVILEIKTNSIPEWCSIQLAAQSNAIGGVNDRYAVALKDDGSYQLKGFVNISDKYIWESLVAIFNHQKNMGLKVFDKGE